MTYLPIDPQELSPEVQKALSSAPAKMMAARGMAPLANPRDVLAVLYQLMLEADEKIKSAATKSFSDLPEKLRLAAGEDPKTHPLVLDRLARENTTSATLLQVVILNQSTSNHTVTELAKIVAAPLCDLIAQNESRLIETPEMVAAIYLNKRARMSTVDRVVELAVRHELDVKNIPAWDELKRTLLSPDEQEPANVLEAAVMDSMYEDAVKYSEEKEKRRDPTNKVKDVVEEVEAPKIRDMTIPMKIRLAILGNSFDRGVLVRDAKKMVAMAAIKSPGVTDSEAAKYASNHSLCDDVIIYIANKGEWVKQYGTKLSLVNNPKTPLPLAMRLMTHLRAKDIRAVSRSKGIPSALATQAKRLLHTKSGGNK